MFVHGLAVPMIINTRTSLVQEFVPKELQGRVFAMINLTVKGVTALSVGATGFIAMAMGINYLFAIWGAVATLLGPLGWAVRSLREAGAETRALIIGGSGNGRFHSGSGSNRRGRPR